MNRVMKNKTDAFDFGKHKGESLRSVVEHDPQYILWLVENKIVEIPQEFIDQAEENILDNEPVEGAWYGDNYGSLED